MTFINFFLSKLGFNFLTIQRLFVRQGLSKKLTMKSFNKLDIGKHIKDVEQLVRKFHYSFIRLFEKRKLFVTLLKDIRHAKGRRIIFNLPLNGQRTKTNAKTIRRVSKKAI